MKLEEERSHAFEGEMQAQHDAVRVIIGRLRERLANEQRILYRHESTVTGKSARGQDTEIAQGRADKKRELVNALQEKLEALEEKAVHIRRQIRHALEFAPLQNDLDHLPPRFRRVREGESRMPNSRFKTFQDVFTPPEAQIVPKGKRASVREYDQIPLHHVPVDPARIPDWFVERFDLAELEELTDFERASGFEKLDMKARLVPEVRNLFMHLTPLEADGQQTHRVMFLEDYAPAYDGMLLVTSYSGRREEEGDCKVMQVFDSAYTAQRREFHAGGKLGKEKRKLRGIRARVKGIQRELIGLRQDDPKRARLSGRLRQEMEAIGRAANPYSREAGEILDSISDIRDRRGQHNPGAACARMVKAVNLLEKRLPGVSKKKNWIDADAAVLEDTIGEGEGLMDQAREAALGICQGLEQGQDIQTQLRGMPDLDFLTVRPFSLYAEKVDQKISDLQSALRSGRQKEAQTQAINAYVACKVFQLQKTQQEIVCDLATSPTETSIEELLLRSTELLEFARSHETFPGVITVENKPYDDMVAKMEKVINGLKRYASRGLSARRRAEMYQRLKQYLEETDFTEILEKL